MPVLETLGGALFGVVLQLLLDKLDSHQVLHYFRERNLDEKLLKKLKRKLMDINAVIDDAEQKQKEYQRKPVTFQLIKEVPGGIGNLIHLRSLDLSNTHIETLPDSMCLLCNLLVLKLNNCLYLKELPATLHELTNLRCLELMGTSLRKAPVLLGKLKNLQVWMDRFDFTDLKNKTNLVGLSLEWKLNLNNDDSIKEREVLENLHPPRHLNHLSIDGYSGTQFPRCLSDNSLSNVVSLTLKHCKHCLWLPSLGLLTFLKHLTIESLDWIGRIDADFYGNSSSSFASLETLSFTRMKEWEEWQCITGAFPSLQCLSMKYCPKLKGKLPEHLSELKQLTIEYCEQLKASIPMVVSIKNHDVKMEPTSFDMTVPLLYHTNLKILCIVSCPSMNIPINHCYPFLEELVISHSCDSLTTFPLDFFPKLYHLQLYECRNLQMILQGHPHNHLYRLNIVRCSEFESFPSEGLCAPQLERFSIEGSEKLKSMPKRMSALLPYLNRLSIRNCPNVEWSEGCLPSNLEDMRLSNCSKLVASLKGAWGTNPSLELFFIGKQKVESFPGIGLPSLSVNNLSIRYCPNLKTLSICPLSSLKNLSLDNCPILQCLPEEGLPKSISDLIIEGCPLLKERCKKQEGEDWEKIAHIKNIWIDAEQVNI
ncbi:internalin A [Vigna unguiculata]|uniref:Internalin A n=1 Tax=Vigna unguiculata TaxID=3917 RepID=A0A4D6LBH1_VIGUN|nr:internalin A [Vigna unguiculata]